MTKQQGQTKRRKGIYLLPNLFTTGGLFAGFVAIVSAMGGKFEVAAIAIFVAMLMDGLDGRVARLTNTESAFGAEYDSLSDMVAFGVAPGLVVYSFALYHLNKLGWIAAFIYVAAGALRLARFNTQVGNADKRFFQGLNIPSAAAVIAGMVWMGAEYHIDGKQLAWPASVVVILVALLMVSNIRYRSFKDLNFKGKVPFVAILILVLIFAMIASYPPEVLFVLASSYAVSGPIMTVWGLRKAAAKKTARAHKL